MNHPDLIYLASIGTVPLNGLGHVQNHLKYLFSCSNDHQQNPATTNNYAFRMAVDPASKRKTLVHGFVGDGKKDYNTAKNAMWNETQDHERLRAERILVGFIVDIGKRTISNMLKRSRSNEEGHNLSHCMPEEVAQCFAEDHHGGNEDALYAAIEARISAPSEVSRTFVSLDKATLSERFAIERKVHELLFKDPMGKNTLLSVSHHDQADPYHVHRLLRM